MVFLHIRFVPVVIAVWLFFIRSGLCTVTNTSTSALPDYVRDHKVYIHVINSANASAPRINESIFHNQLSGLKDSWADYGFSFQLQNITYTTNTTWYNLPAAYNGGEAVALAQGLDSVSNSTEFGAVTAQYQQIYTELGAALRVGDHMDINLYLTGNAVTQKSSPLTSFTACAKPLAYQDPTQGLLLDGCFVTLDELEQDSQYLQKILSDWFYLDARICLGSAASKDLQCIVLNNANTTDNDADNVIPTANGTVTFALPVSSLGHNDSTLTGTSPFPDKAVGLAQNACAASQAGNASCVGASTGETISTPTRNATNKLLDYDPKYCLHILSCSPEFPEGYMCETPGTGVDGNGTIPTVLNIRNRVYSSLLYSSLLHNYCVAGGPGVNVTGELVQMQKSIPFEGFSGVIPGAGSGRKEKRGGHSYAICM